MRDAMTGKVCTTADTAMTRSMATDATVSCGLCGAKAHDPFNVCDPVQLPEVGHLGD